MRRCSFCQMPGPECRAGVCESSRLAKACGWAKSERSLWICIHCTRTYRGRIDFEAVAAATQGLCLLCAQAGAEALHTNIATSVCSSRPAITLLLGAKYYVTGCSSCRMHTTHRHRHIRRTVRHGGGFNSTVMASDDIPGGCDPSLCAPRCASTGGCSRRWRGRCGCSARCCNFIGQRLSLAGGRIVGCFRASPGGRTERASGRGVVGGALATI